MAKALKGIKIDKFKNCFEQWKKISQQTEWIFYQLDNNIYKGGPKKPLEFIYKKLCIYSYMFKLQSPS